MGPVLQLPLVTTPFAGESSRAVVRFFFVELFLTIRIVILAGLAIREMES